ncbi:MAG: hypothetical protein OTI34_02615 [Lewinella sp.]|nr:hypothetical protein [Lewinella sp.]
MDTRIFFLALIVCLLTACECKDVDAFGLRPTILVPITSSPAQSNFTVGDTLWWEADFSNQVAVRDVNQRMDLRNFDFFPSFSFQSIEGTEVSSDSTIRVVPISGDIMFAFSTGTLIYEIVPEKDDNSCSFKFGTVLLKQGVYVAGVSTLELLYDFYEHPALYACGNRRREVFVTNYINSSSNRSDYESLYERLGTSDLLANTSYERYAAVGGISFTVTE